MQSRSGWALSSAGTRREMRVRPRTRRDHQVVEALGTPTLAFVDTGVGAAHLIGQDATRLADPGGAAGPILETFVSMEIARQ